MLFYVLSETGLGFGSVADRPNRTTTTYTYLGIVFSNSDINEGQKYKSVEHFSEQIHFFTGAIRNKSDMSKVLQFCHILYEPDDKRTLPFIHTILEFALEIRAFQSPLWCCCVITDTKHKSIIENFNIYFCLLIGKIFTNTNIEIPLFFSKSYFQFNTIICLVEHWKIESADFLFILDQDYVWVGFSPGVFSMKFITWGRDPLVIWGRDPWCWLLFCLYCWWWYL